MKNKIKLVIAILFFTNTLYAQNDNSQEKTKQEKGYFNITELGYYAGNSNIRRANDGTSSSVDIKSLRTINGLFLTQKFSLGIGIGVDGVKIKDYGFFNTVNAFADVRYYLKDDEDGYFFYMDLGSAIKISSDTQKGLLLNLGVGHKFMLSDNFIIVPSIGYNQQDFKVTSTKYSNETLALKIGMLF
ncbi:MAG: hypothetical protein WC622_05010 [Pedobacter sp.]|jgi:hypothetical protein|uniref:hypothetical protein n=1 Tax=Pedobacter sp. TaxID=1411316 RepID=UPI0035629877